MIYSPSWRNFISAWLWEFYRYRVREQFRKEHDFDLLDAGYCLDARDRIR